VVSSLSAEEFLPSPPVRHADYGQDKRKASSLGEEGFFSSLLFEEGSRDTFSFRSDRRKEVVAFPPMTGWTSPPPSLRKRGRGLPPSPPPDPDSSSLFGNEGDFGLGVLSVLPLLLFL